MTMRLGIRMLRICTRPALRSTALSTATRYPFRNYSSAITTEQTKFKPEEPRLSITFTCTVPNCGERTSHVFTKRAYQKGIVIIQCPGCKNRHLIADNLGWFKDDRTEDGSLKNIEDIMRSKGETVTKGRLDAGGVVEYSD